MSFVSLSFDGMTEQQVEVCRIFYDHCHGIVGVCSDDPMKVRAGLVARGAQGPFLHDAAEGLASLSNWYIHKRPIEHTQQNRLFQFSCSEQVMTSLKLTYFKPSLQEELEWLDRMKAAGQLPGMAKRAWPGLVKDMGRQFLPPLPAGSTLGDDVHEAEKRSCAARFTQANKEGLQLKVQRVKFASGEKAFVDMIQTIALYNKNNPEHAFKLTEATFGDLHYSCAADYNISDSCCLQPTAWRFLVWRLTVSPAGEQLCACCCRSTSSA